VFAALGRSAPSYHSRAITLRGLLACYKHNGTWLRRSSATGKVTES